jgi:hypothetical protein
MAHRLEDNGVRKPTDPRNAAAFIGDDALHPWSALMLSRALFLPLASAFPRFGPRLTIGRP